MKAWELMGMKEKRWMKLTLRNRIRLATWLYLGWRYAGEGTKTQVAYESGSVPGSLVVDPGATDRYTNCSTLTTSSYMAVRPDIAWTDQEYGDMQVFYDRLPNHDCPIDAIERVDAGTRVTASEPDAEGKWPKIGIDDLKPGMYLCQGVKYCYWNDTKDAWKFAGHAFYVQVLPEDHPEEILIVESWGSWSRGGVGPRWKYSTIEKLHSTYELAVHLALLKDDDGD
jgi:hypothetical protein